jgi:hypothetical protein
VTYPQQCSKGTIATILQTFSACGDNFYHTIAIATIPQGGGVPLILAIATMPHRPIFPDGGINPWGRRDTTVRKIEVLLKGLAEGT